MARYKNHVMEVLRQREGYDQNDTSFDTELDKLSPQEAFGESLMSLDEKVESIVEQIADMHVDFDEWRNIVRMALKQQDRDTRHACAEAVMGVKIPSTLPGWDLVVDGMAMHFHDAVMNCSGGLESKTWWVKI